MNYGRLVKSLRQAFIKSSSRSFCALFYLHAARHSFDVRYERTHPSTMRVLER